MKGLYRGFHRNENGTQTIVLNGEKIKGDWVYGDLSKMRQYVYISHFEFDDTYMDGKENTHLYKHTLVLPETVCEAVRGLTDINGKQVFEGDKVKWCSIEGIIAFELHRFYVKGNILWDFGHDDEIEVIGTIFDEQFAEGKI